MARPVKWPDPGLFDKAVDAYFDRCDVDDEPYTVTGLALALNLSRQGLLEYSGKPLFSDTIKRAKLKIENYAERRLFGNNVAGVIFNLKNNFKWVDKHEHGIGGNEDGKPLAVTFTPAE